MIFGHDVFEYMEIGEGAGSVSCGSTDDETIEKYKECRLTFNAAVDCLMANGWEHKDAVEQLEWFETDCGTSHNPGCMDPDANNYNSDATEDDGSCTYDSDPIPGCTDEAATNYDEEATEDDDSCEYEDTMFSDFEDWQLALGAVVLVLLLK